LGERHLLLEDEQEQRAVARLARPELRQAVLGDDAAERLVARSELERGAPKRACREGRHDARP
jgi:hypothetical protein